MTPKAKSDDQRPAETTAATGDQWVIGHGHQRAVITEMGATLRSFTWHDQPVIHGFGPHEWSHGGRGQVLAPWPNRLGDGTYSFDGEESHAALDEPEHRNAIHGLVRWMPWRMVGRAQNRVSMECVLHPSPGYPYTLGLKIEYRLGREGLKVETEAENLGAQPLPFGLGFHPYLAVGPDRNCIDSARLTVPASIRLVSDDRGLPFAEAPVAGTSLDFASGRMIGTTRLDMGFTGLLRDADGRVRVSLAMDSTESESESGAEPEATAATSRTTTLWADEQFNYLMIYTGDTQANEAERRTAVAVEPMTCAPDAFRSGKGLVTIKPGGKWSGSWGINPR